MNTSISNSTKKIHRNYWGNQNKLENERRKVFMPPKLSYSYNALEPLYDVNSLKDHYLSYHMRSFEELFDLINNTRAEKMSINEILSEISSFSDELKFTIGGFYNHQLFWDNLSPYGGMFSEYLEKAIIDSFGSIYEFKSKFLKMGLRHNGCGWAWLVYTNNGKLEMFTSKGNENPVMECSSQKGIPLLTIDLWEHAYFSVFKSHKKEYLRVAWNLINWNEVSYRLDKAII